MKFEFTTQESQVILNALTQRPFIEVVDVINKLQSQAAEQINPAPLPAEVTAEV